jgi:hypothetical protein
MLRISQVPWPCECLSWLKLALELSVFAW